ncbi:hypothetical protein H2198_008253 [Neophaeococcomyces mojaviensis]|uniref:Uncharacterized protein n=1 Tax=Neophaeococcomyces mojaviensis TaxID=3383035 RepID=A0ACC2ZXW8_9EURO|nr:hypothetical protein H2198_008253 [Knufia sp. JES_112]
MPLPKYEYTGPIDHTVVPDRSKMEGRSVIVTGGANGMGEVMVRQFVNAGAFVTFGDMHPRGADLEKELNTHGEKAAFVKCDIRNWDDQVKLFETAERKSPNNSVDVVIANAGISRSSGDSLWVLDDPNAPPVKPELNIVNVNMIGTLYTWKLAVYHFRRQPDTDERDRCFIITGSMTAYIDSPGNWEYTSTKYALRGFMKTVRRSSWEQGIRINYVAPCWIKSAIRSKEYETWLMERGIEFGEQEDCAGAMMRIACDKSVNGRSLMITPRTVCEQGFLDVDREDYNDPKDQYFAEKQVSQLNVIQDKWLDNYKGDRVAATAVPGCGRDDCPECSRSLPQLCEIAHHSGIGQDGFFAPYAALDARAVVLVPEGISSSVAAVATDAVITSYHAITRRAEVKPHETVFLFGLGGLGFNALQIVLHIGARVIVSDVRQERLDEAVRIGVPPEDVVPLNSSIRDFVQEKGLLIDTTLDFVGKHQTFQDAQNILRRGGKMLCVGTLDGENTIDMKIGIRKRLTILFTYGAQRRDLEEVLDLIASGVIKPQVENAPFRDFPRLLKELCDGRIKARVVLLYD